MRTTASFDNLDSASRDLWRKRYCAGLEKAQALLLEMMIPACRGLSIERRGTRVGYALINPARILVEFFLEPPAWGYADSIAAQLVQDCEIKGAIVKSFDAMMLSSLSHVQRGVEVMGFLARDYIPAPLALELAPEMHSARAEMRDLPELLAIRQDVFADPARFEAAVQAQEVLCYRNKDEQLVGFGMLRVVRPEHEALEINLAVDPPFRRRAYAAYMLEDLVKRSLAQGMQPIASCPIDNQASRILGERIGLRSRDRLLKLKF